MIILNNSRLSIMFIKSRADLNAILPGKLNWSFVHYVTGKKIIADCGKLGYC